MENKQSCASFRELAFLVCLGPLLHAAPAHWISGQALRAQGPATGVLSSNAIQVPTGTPMGSRFGESLAAGVFHGHPTADPFNEPLVGAPGEGIVSFRGQVITSPLAGPPAERSFGTKIVTVDLDGDQSDEIVISEPLASTQGWFQNGAVHIFWVEASGQLCTNPITIHGSVSRFKLGWHIAPAGDTNGDGFEDLIVSTWRFPYMIDGHRFTWREPRTDFEARELTRPFPLPRLYQGVASGVGDIDGDGYDDVMCAEMDGPPSVRSGFTGLVIDAHPSWVAVRAIAGRADLDGDGRPEIALTDFSGETVHVRFSDPNTGGWFEYGAVTFAPGGFAREAVFGDVTGNGRPELAVLPDHGSDYIDFLSLLPDKSFLVSRVARESGAPSFCGAFTVIDRAIHDDPSVPASERAPSLLVGMASIAGGVAELRPTFPIASRPVRSFERLPDFHAGRMKACETASERRTRLTLSGRPLIGERIGIQLEHGAPNRCAFLIAATAPVYLTLPLAASEASCLLLFEGSGVYDAVPRMTDAAGAVLDFEVTIPQSVADVPIYLQWVVLDPLAPNQMGVSSTPVHHLRAR